jgi:ubiquitin C-terminal hydrolase
LAGLGRGIGDNKSINLDQILTLKTGDRHDIHFRLRSVICKSGSRAGGHYILVYFYYNRNGSVTKIVYNDGMQPFIANASFDFDGHSIDDALKYTSTTVMYERIK